MENIGPTYIQIGEFFIPHRQLNCADHSLPVVQLLPTYDLVRLAQNGLVSDLCKVSGQKNI